MLKVTDKMLAFVRENAVAMDRSLARMAVDIERLSKAQVPLLTGALRASGHFQRKSPLKYQVIYNKVYARFQEFGGDTGRVVKKYTTPGTKKFYLRDAGRTITKNALDYIKSEVRGIRI